MSTNHLNSDIYDSYFMYRDINYVLNNPIYKRKHDLKFMSILRDNIRKNVSFNSISKFISKF